MILDYGAKELILACTHPSYANERGLADDNQRLEFLGDAVLGLAVSQALYLRHRFAEGELTRWRAALVREESLAAWARRLELGPRLRLGRGEEQSGGRNRPSVLADAMEAVIGAVFLRSGYEAAADFVRAGLGSEIEALQEGIMLDAKTDLQELCQARGLTLTYRLDNEEGPPHDKRFSVSAIVGGSTVAAGSGRSKKEAEQGAARSALQKLQGAAR